MQDGKLHRDECAQLVVVQLKAHRAVYTVNTSRAIADTIVKLASLSAVL